MPGPHDLPDGDGRGQRQVPPGKGNDRSGGKLPSSLNQRLRSQDVLAEIPSQVVQYMQRNGIKPELPDVEIATRSMQRFGFDD